MSSLADRPRDGAAPRHYWSAGAPRSESPLSHYSGHSFVSFLHELRRLFPFANLKPIMGAIRPPLARLPSCQLRLTTPFVMMPDPTAPTVSSSPFVRILKVETYLRV